MTVSPTGSGPASSQSADFEGSGNQYLSSEDLGVFATSSPLHSSVLLSFHCRLWRLFLKAREDLLVAHLFLQYAFDLLYQEIIDRDVVFHVSPRKYVIMLVFVDLRYFFQFSS